MKITDLFRGSKVRKAEKAMAEQKVYEAKLAEIARLEESCNACQRDYNGYMKQAFELEAELVNTSEDDLPILESKIEFIKGCAQGADSRAREYQELLDALRKEVYENK